MVNSQVWAAERSVSQIQVPTAPNSTAGNKIDLNLKPIQIIPNSDHLFLDTGILFQNKPALTAMLLDGANLNIKIEILVEKLNMLSNDVLFEETIIYNIRYDLLRRDFMLDNAGKKSYFKNFDDLLKKYFEDLKLNIPLNEPLETQETYKITLKPSILHAEVPPWLKKALFFWSWEIVYPYPYHYEFSYEPSSH